MAFTGTFPDLSRHVTKPQFHCARLNSCRCLNHAVFTAPIPTESFGIHVALAYLRLMFSSFRSSRGWLLPDVCFDLQFVSERGAKRTAGAGVFSSVVLLSSCSETAAAPYSFIFSSPFFSIAGAASSIRRHGVSAPPRSLRRRPALIALPVRYYMLNIFQNPSTHSHSQSLAKRFDASRVKAELSSAT
jgi:hypothetical protein